MRCAGACLARTSISAAPNGVVYRAETGSQDAGAAITGEMVLAFTQLGATARQ